MTWIKVDTRIRSHPKLLAIPPDSRWFYVCSLCYSADYRTHGLIPNEALSSVVPDAKRPRSVSKPLTSAGLWVPVDGGWQIHDYGDYQQSFDDDGGPSRARAGTGAGARAHSRGRARAQARPREEVEVEEENVKTNSSGGAMSELEREPPPLPTDFLKKIP